MATARIARREIDAGALPAICVAAGESTTRTVRHTFQWAPPGASWALIGEFAMYGVARARLRRDFAFRVPIASWRRGHWLQRRAFASIGFVGCAALVMIGFTNSAILIPGSRRIPIPE